MARRVRPYRIANFAGENDRDGLTNQEVYGQRGRMLHRVRGYHLIGYGRLLSRRGHRPYVSSAINGANAVQGLAVYEFGTTRELLGVAGGQIRKRNGSSWDNITGAATLASGQDKQIRFTSFQDGTGSYVLATDGDNPVVLWNGTGNVTVMNNANYAGAPAKAADIKEFHGHVFVLGTEVHRCNLRASTYGQIDWVQQIILDPYLGSDGVGLAQHSQDVLLCFYKRAVWRIEFNRYGGEKFQAFPVVGSETEGCESKASIATKDGWTYYVSRRGVHRIGNPRGRSEYISGPIEGFWEELNQARLPYVWTVDRGWPWNEILFLASHGSSTTHNVVMVWNTRLEGWSIFPIATVDGKMEFNCGVNWRDANGIDRTLVGDYSGVVHEAWGAADSDTGYTDDGADIETELQTGFLDFGYPGVSSTRELFADMELVDQKTFNLQYEAVGARPVGTRTMKTEAAGDELDDDFMLDESFLSASSISFAYTKVDIDSRYLQTRISLRDNGPPHVFTALTWTNIPKAVRLF